MKMTPEVRQAVLARAAGRCELGIARVCQGAVSNVSHRRHAGMGGKGAKGQPDTAATALGACGDGVRGCHGWISTTGEGRAAAYEAGWLLRAGQDELTTPVLLRGRLVLLDRDGGWRLAQQQP